MYVCIYIYIYIADFFSVWVFFHSAIKLKMVSYLIHGVFLKQSYPL